MKTHTPEMGLPKLHGAIARVKTPHIGEFFKAIEV
jgi:hypothetical protein